MQMIDPDLAYFVGTLHSDGGLYDFYYEKENRVVHRFRFEIGKESLPMLCKVQEITRNKFGRNVKILPLKSGTFLFEVWINRLLPSFNQLEIENEKIPSWISKNRELFCSYLSGLIDGDGSVFISKRGQCRVRVYSKRKIVELINLIEKHLNCKPWIEKSRRLSSNGKERIIFFHTFLVSSKNESIFKKFCLPHIQIKHKKDKIKNFYHQKKRMFFNLSFLALI